MNKVRMYLASVTVLVAAVVCVAGQGDTKRYEKDGLSFSYPSAWVIQDGSNSAAVIINLVPPASDLQVQVSMRRESFDTPEKVVEGKEKVVDTTIKSYDSMMRKMDMIPTRTDGTSTIGGAAAEVAHLRGSLDGTEGEAGIHWATINNRIVTVVTFGPDKDLKKLTAALDALRASITTPASVATPAQTPVPSPSPTPKQ
jgi:hypothetical protein